MNKATNLAPDDYERLLAFLEASQAVPALEAFPEFIVTCLPDVVASDSISYNEVDPIRRRMISYLRPEKGRFPGDFELLASLMHQHPLITYHRHHRDGRALKISDFLSDADFRRLDIYRLFYSRLFTNYQMAIMLPAPEPLIIGIALNRTRDDFSERDRLLLNLLRPHIEYLHRRLEQGRQTERDLTSLRQAVEVMNQGAIFLGTEGEVELLNPRALSIIGRYFDADADVTKLPPRLRDWCAEQRRGLTASADGTAPAEVLVIHGVYGGSLVCRYLHALDVNDRDIVLLEEAPPMLRVDAMTRLGLTRREAQVLGMVSEGRTNGEVARLLGSSERTVQKHLEHIYRKLGVGSRGAAVASAARALDAEST